jgi:ribosomal protein S18 acetylase RimI-like enzyme
MYLNGEHSMFLMGYDKEVIAFAFLRKVGMVSSLLTAHIEFLCVEATQRSHGLGRIFVNEITKYYLQKYDLLTLQCSDDLLKFYQRNGFDILSRNSYWQNDRYNMMFIGMIDCNKTEEREAISKEITDRMNRDVWIHLL